MSRVTWKPTKWHVLPKPLFRSLGFCISRKKSPAKPFQKVFIKSEVLGFRISLSGKSQMALNADTSKPAWQSVRQISCKLAQLAIKMSGHWTLSKKPSECFAYPLKDNHLILLGFYLFFCLFRRESFARDIPENGQSHRRSLFRGNLEGGIELKATFLQFIVWVFCSPSSAWAVCHLGAQ